MNEDELIVIDEPMILEEPEAILDDEHLPLVMQGAIDVVEGNESYPARYLAGCMVSAGFLSNEVAGAESVWESVKSGFTKAVTYVKNFFMGIWNFFFGKDTEEADKKLEEDVKKEEAEMAKVPGDAEPSNVSGLKSAINTAATKIQDLASEAVTKLNNGITKAKILAAEANIQENLEKVIKEMNERIAAMARNAKTFGGKAKDALSILKSSALSWAAIGVTLFKSRVQTAAKTTKAKIEELEALVRNGVEEKKAEIVERLNSLRELMKSYTIIENLKKNLRTFITALKTKLKPSFFKKADA